MTYLRYLTMNAGMRISRSRNRTQQTTTIPTNAEWLFLVDAKVEESCTWTTINAASTGRSSRAITVIVYVSSTNVSSAYSQPSLSTINSSGGFVLQVQHSSPYKYSDNKNRTQQTTMIPTNAEWLFLVDAKVEESCTWTTINAASTGLSSTKITITGAIGKTPIFSDLSRHSVLENWIVRTKLGRWMKVRNQ